MEMLLEHKNAIIELLQPPIELVEVVQRRRVGVDQLAALPARIIGVAQRAGLGRVRLRDPPQRVVVEAGRAAAIAQAQPPPQCIVLIMSCWPPRSDELPDT